MAPGCATQSLALGVDAEAQSRPVAQIVLVVDDYAETRELFTKFLQFAGYDVATAEDGQEAIERAVLLCPAVILLDLAMPMMSGFETAERLKADQRTRTIPIIAVTALGGPEWEEKACQAGCQGFLVKPVSREVPHRAVRRVLE